MQLQGLKEIALASSVDVSKEGVGGAKNFFEARAKAAQRYDTYNVVFVALTLQTKS